MLYFNQMPHRYFVLTKSVPTFNFIDKQMSSNCYRIILVFIPNLKIFTVLIFPTLTYK